MRPARSFLRAVWNDSWLATRVEVKENTFRDVVSVLILAGVAAYFTPEDAAVPAIAVALFAALLFPVLFLIFKLLGAPRRLLDASADLILKQHQESAALRQRIEELSHPRFFGEIATAMLGQKPSGEVTCLVTIRVSNCGVIPSTLDDWQGRIRKADGEIIEMVAAHSEEISAWKEGSAPGVGPPDVHVTADQYIYERVGNDPIQPGHKASGYLMLESSYRGKPLRELVQGATLVVDAIDSAGVKHTLEQTFKDANLEFSPRYVPGLRSR